MGAMPTTDVLILGVARQGPSIMPAGMTTERDPVTGLRWVRTPTLQPLSPEALRYEDGELVRPGDVIRVALEPTEVQAPFVEAAAWDFQDQAPQRMRRL